MTKKDYIKFAEALKAEKPQFATENKMIQWRLDVRAIASVLAQDNGRFRSRAELDELYGFLSPDDKTVVYCRIGERSSHTWFVLTHLLGKPGVRNYDGSWTEWGNTVRVPIAVGPEPGRAHGSS